MVTDETENTYITTNLMRVNLRRDGELEFTPRRTTVGYNVRFPYDIEVIKQACRTWHLWREVKFRHARVWRMGLRCAPRRLRTIQ